MAFYFLMGLEHLRGALQDVGVYEHCTIRFVREKQASSNDQISRILYMGFTHIRGMELHEPFVGEAIGGPPSCSLIAMLITLCVAPYISNAEQPRPKARD